MMQNIPTKLLKDIKLKEGNQIPILSKITHELKTPIHGIRGILSYLVENWDDIRDDDKKKHLATVIEAGDNLNDLLNSLLINTNQKDELEFNFERINLIEIAESTVERYKNLSFTKNKISIEFESNNKECNVRVDKFWISQLLLNLVANAVNYSKEGKVVVSANVGKVGKIDVCTISVKDEGIGIAKGELKTIFNPFYRGSNDIETEGAGIGLAICKEIVEAHGGRISASNNKDVGSTVEFYIPID